MKNREVVTDRAGSIGNMQHPLVSLLTQEAATKGHSLTALAKELGVTYERFTQWRRAEADIGNAKRTVHEAAAMYLGIPPILVLGLCRKFELNDFVVPSCSPLEERLQIEISRLKSHQLLGGFVPRELDGADDSVQLFVVFLVRQLEARSATQAHWQSLMQALANARNEASQIQKASTQSAAGGLFL